MLDPEQAKMWTSQRNCFDPGVATSSVSRALQPGGHRIPAKRGGLVTRGEVLVSRCVVSLPWTLRSKCPLCRFPFDSEAEAAAKMEP